MITFPSILAVHIADGTLQPPWWIGGFILAALLVLLAAWRIRDEEIPQVALLTAVFFIASSIPVPLGPGSTHLLLTGLMGVILGRRAPLAILIAITLQALLLQHGGTTMIGINTCVMALPALLAWQMFAALKRMPWLRRPWFRAFLVAGCTIAWSLIAVYSVAILLTNPFGQASKPDTGWANHIILHPITLSVIVVLAGLVAWGESRLENAPEFPVGLLIGGTAVLATVFLNFLVLAWGGGEAMREVGFYLFITHLPIAVVEGIVVGFTLGFLARVKPQMLGWKPMEKTECTADVVS